MARIVLVYLMFFLLYIFSFKALAKCDKPVTYLLEGSQAPCTGFLFTPEQEAKVRLADLDLSIQKEINAIQQQQLGILKEDNKLLSEQNNLWRNRAEDSTKRLIESESNKTWKMFLYFLAGAAVTTAITYGVNQ